MDFDVWWESEGVLMAEGGCSPKVIASAAWTVARQGSMQDGNGSKETMQASRVPEPDRR